jgi:hypothetical protein
VCAFNQAVFDKFHEPVFRQGVDLARRDHQILLVFAATILVNGAAEAFDRLFPKRLVELGLPEVPDPIVWLTALGLVTLALGAVALRIVEARIDGVGVARRVYAVACFIGALGLAVLALAPDDLTGMAGVLLVNGIAWTVTRRVSVIWVNRRTTSDVRATVQSFLAQVEYFGEIFLGVGLGILAQATSIATAMTGACVLVAGAGVLVARSRPERRVGGRVVARLLRAGSSRVPIRVFAGAVVSHRDFRTLFPLCVVIRDREGELARLGIRLGRWSEDRPDYPRWLTIWTDRSALSTRRRSSGWCRRGLPLRAVGGGHGAAAREGANQKTSLGRGGRAAISGPDLPPTAVTGGSPRA